MKMYIMKSSPDEYRVGYHVLIFTVKSLWELGFNTRAQVFQSERRKNGKIEKCNHGNSTLPFLVHNAH